MPIGVLSSYIQPIDIFNNFTELKITDVKPLKL